MKRFHFLAAIFGIGVAKAQTAIICGDLQHPKPCPPRNNQCPVCKTMADSMKRQYGYKSTACNQPVDPSLICVISKEEYGPTERLARCKNCNAAFWQDAE